MPLSAPTIESNLLAILNPSSAPESLQIASDRWATAYHSYANSALAGVMVATGLVKETISSAIMSDPDFFSGLSAGILSYWTAAVWAGPGFTGVTVNAAGLLQLLNPVRNQLVSSKDVDLIKSANELSKTLHSYTKGITVSATNVSSGATAVVTLE